LQLQLHLRLLLLLLLLLLLWLLLWLRRLWLLLWLRRLWLRQHTPVALIREYGQSLPGQALWRGARVKETINEPNQPVQGRLGRVTC
jgi:hypothetical protein